MCADLRRFVPRSIFARVRILGRPVGGLFLVAPYLRAGGFGGVETRVVVFVNVLFDGPITRVKLADGVMQNCATGISDTGNGLASVFDGGDDFNRRPEPLSVASAVQGKPQLPLDDRSPRVLVIEQKARLGLADPRF